jgi:hypothetical protein
MGAYEPSLRLPYQRAVLSRPCLLLQGVGLYGHVARLNGSVGGVLACRWRLRTPARSAQQGWTAFGTFDQTCDPRLLTALQYLVATDILGGHVAAHSTTYRRIGC